jgi:hypothetical protein
MAASKAATSKNKVINKAKNDPYAELQHDGLSNEDILAIFEGNDVNVGLCPVVIDIVPTQTEGKSTVYCIAEVEFEGGQTASGGSGGMNELQLDAQDIEGGPMIQRAMITFSDDNIEALGLDKGQPLIVNDRETRVVSTEAWEPFYQGQRPIGYTDDDGEWVNKLKVNEDGEESPFYRDTMLTYEDKFNGHSLL